MQRSIDRILTTHTGSLPRPDDLVAMVEGKDQQQVLHDDVFDRRVAASWAPDVLVDPAGERMRG